MAENGGLAIPFKLVDEIEFDPNKVYFLGRLEPKEPGVRQFILRLQCKDFTSESEMGKEVYLLRCANAYWIIFGIPGVFMKTAEKSAIESGVRIVETVLATSVPDANIRLPVRGQNIFRLEYDPSLGLCASDLLAEEDAMVNMVTADLSIKRNNAHLS